MTLFFSLLPLYLFGNIHCLGMCGPLVMLIGQNRYRYFYFVGRLLSFSLAAMIAGAAGAVLHVFLKKYYLAEMLIILFGLSIALWGGYQLFKTPSIRLKKNNPNSHLSKIQHWIATLMLKDRAWPTFLFGFFTVAMPCGQTLIVFSACALAGDPLVGLANGFALAFLTSPSLFFAMHSLALLKKLKGYDRVVLGASSILIGALAMCRGFAELGWISHLVLNTDNLSHYHIVIY